MRDEHDGFPRIAFLLAGVGHRGLALEALPGDACDRVHALAHLVEHFARMRVVPGKADAPGQLVDQTEIFFRLAPRLDRCSSELHPAVVVDYTSDISHPSI